MKKRIGSKLYDTDKGIPVIPELNLYKQPNKRTFYTFDGATITPVSYDEAAEMIRGAGDPELYSSIFSHKADNKGMGRVAVSIEHLEKLAAYSRKVGIPQKKLLESYIDSLEL